MVDDLKLNGNELNIYALLFSFWRNNGFYYGDMEYIAKRIGVYKSAKNNGVRTVFNNIHKLIDKEYINIETEEVNGNKTKYNYFINEDILKAIVKNTTDTIAKNTTANHCKNDNGTIVKNTINNKSNNKNTNNKNIYKAMPDKKDTINMYWYDYLLCIKELVKDYDEEADFKLLSKSEGIFRELMYKADRIPDLYNDLVRFTEDYISDLNAFNDDEYRTKVKIIDILENYKVELI